MPAQQQAETHTVTAAEGPPDENGPIPTTPSTAKPPEQGHQHVDKALPRPQSVPSDGTQAIAMMAYESALQSMDHLSPNPSKVLSGDASIGVTMDPSASRAQQSNSNSPGVNSTV